LPAEGGVAVGQGGAGRTQQEAGLEPFKG